MSTGQSEFIGKFNTYLLVSDSRNVNNQLLAPGEIDKDLFEVKHLVSMCLICEETLWYPLVRAIPSLIPIPKVDFN
jgi:hypothetical protein